MSEILVESERLLLRRPEDGDVQSLEQVYGDPLMMRYLGNAWTSDKVAEAFQDWREGWGVGNRWNGVLLRKDTLEPIGTAGLAEDTIPDEPGLDLSWFVLPRHQKQGFATEITGVLLHFAFESLGATRVVAETHPENPASNKVLEKLHFECLGERHDIYDDLPGFDTQVLWEFVRARWQQGSS